MSPTFATLRIEEPPLYAPVFMNPTGVAYPCAVHHFQLRHLLAVPSAARILFSSRNSEVWQWDAVGDPDVAETRLLSFKGEVGPHTSITTLSATPDVLVAGGYFGELVAKGLGEGAEARVLCTSRDFNITNHIAPFARYSPDGRFLASFNDGASFTFDAHDGGRLIPFVRNPTAINVNCALSHQV